MKTSRIKRFLAHLAGVTLFLYLPLESATLAVLPGESIQAQIDAATEGDVIAIFGGTYDQNVIVNKSVRLAEVEGEEVTITGNITFTGLTDPPPFAGFKTGSGGRRIVISGVTGFLVENIDSTAGDTIEINSDSDVLIRGGQHRALSMANGVVEIHSSQFSGTVTQNGGELEVYSTSIGGNMDTADAATKTLAFRTEVSGDCVWRSNRSWFAYSKATSFNHWSDNDRVIIIGSELNRGGNTESCTIRLEGSGNSFVVRNSYIHGTKGRCDSNNDDKAIEVDGVHELVLIENNYIQTVHGGYGCRDYTVKVSSDPNAIIQNNIFDAQNTDWNRPVYAPFGALVRNNILTSGNIEFRAEGGVLAIDNLNASFESIFGTEFDPYTLAEGSPCIDAGVEDARYNDLDGTRNDIGPSGGAAWDPDGWTTENPVMIAFELSTDQVLEGQTTSIELSEAFGVSAP
jgi:hypothetical protein